MLGDSREEKLASARKKLKQYQIKKEAEKMKMSGSRQSTPDSQPELVISNGKGATTAVDVNIGHPLLEDISSENITENTSLVDQNTDMNASYLHHKSDQPDIQSNDIFTGTPHHIVMPEAPVACDESHSEHSSIQHYFKNNMDKADSQNLFDNISSFHRHDDTYQIANSINQEHTSNSNFTPEVLASEPQTLPSENAISQVLTIDSENQLEVHTQTISILVASKADLQSQLQQSQHSLKERDDEVQNLMRKLDTSNNEVNLLQESTSFLTKELNTISESVDKSNEDRTLQSKELEKYRDTCDDIKMMNEELNLRLSKEFESKSQIEQELINTKSKLELATIHIQQLRDSSNEDLAKEISALKQSQEESQNQIESLQSSLTQAISDKASIEQEYKAYGNHLIAQLEVSFQKITQTEAAMKGLTQAKVELQGKLDALKTEQETNEKSQSNRSDEEVEKLNKHCRDLSLDNNSLKDNYSALETNNKSLSKLCAEQRESLEKLEVAVEMRDSNEVDTSQLLQAMQSDKVAAARALSQNKHLKEQLEELQNGFIMMSNKKLELTEKLEVESHFKRRLQKELSDVKEQISIYSQRASQKTERSNAITDDAKLGTESEVTKSGENTNFTAHDEFSSCSHPVPISVVDASTQVDSILQQTRKSVADALMAAHDSPDDHSSTNKDDQPAESEVDKDQFVRQDTHFALVNRFTRCMRDLAAAQDEKQSLEHLVQRLQLETEAVGDYITIYQFQRGVMKKEVEEMNSELTQLKEEREKMHTKLAFLQNLVRSLTGENGISEENVDAEDGHAKNETKPSEEANSVREPTEAPSDQPQDKKQTVRKIMNLISDMESSSHVDISGLSKFHPCPLCSGKLINV